jgi:YD repeat-containing protein
LTFNRVRTVTKKSTSAQVAEYVYDAAGRRIRKTVSNGGLSGTATNGTTCYRSASSFVTSV